MAIEKTSFKLNFSRYSWKENLTVQTELPKLKDFLIRLQRSWEEAMKSIELVKDTMKRQFNKKRRNPQGLKAEDNV